MEDFVVIKTFTYPHDMISTRALLESSGIRTFAKDELTTLVNPLLSNAVGGIKLMVAANDVAAALAILDETIPINTK